MAFGWLKKAATTIGKIATAPVKVVVKIGKTPVGKIAGKVLTPVYNNLVPEQVRKIIKKVATIAPLAKLLKPKGAITVNEFEQAARDLITAALSMKDKSALEIVLSIGPMLLDMQEIAALINDVPKEEYVPQLKAALDNMIGDEANALIGSSPNAKIKIDIPYVGIEAFTDLILQGTEKAILAQASSNSSSE